MSGLFEFLTVFNLIVILICVIGLYYSINLVIYYYAPTSTGFVNMYFLYYIFFITTLLVAVGCNNYIEMNGGSVVAAAAVAEKMVRAKKIIPTVTAADVRTEQPTIPTSFQDKL
jgi:hypothetical protein